MKGCLPYSLQYPPSVCIHLSQVKADVWKFPPAVSPTSSLVLKLLIKKVNFLGEIFELL